MLIGLSIYSMNKNIQGGKWSITDAIRYAASIGAQGIEWVPFVCDLIEHPELIPVVKDTCAEVGVPIVNYALNADLIHEDAAVREQHMDNVRRHIDIAHDLGLGQMRHDVSGFRRPMHTNTPENFERELPLMIEQCRILADYAAQYGMTTLIENHGFFVNGAERVLRLIQGVDRPNIKMLIDVGNYLCVDLDPVFEVRKALPYAGMIHMKDFYIRDERRMAGVGGDFNCDNGQWFRTVGGQLLRGAVLGQGDVDMQRILSDIRTSYDGTVTLEFEGMENDEDGCAMGLRYLGVSA